MSRYVALMVDGRYTVHAPEASGAYVTLCGESDNDDPALCGIRTAVLIGAKITCRTCIAIIELARGYGKRDFAPDSERT